MLQKKGLEEKNALRDQAIKRLRQSETDLLMVMPTAQAAIRQFFKGFEHLVDDVANADGESKIGLMRIIPNTNEVLRVAMARGVDRETKALGFETPAVPRAARTQLEKVIEQIFPLLTQLLRPARLINRDPSVDDAENTTSSDEVSDRSPDEENAESSGKEKASEGDNRIAEEERNDFKKPATTPEQEAKLQETIDHFNLILQTMADKKMIFSDPTGITMTAFLRNMPCLNQAQSKIKPQQWLKILSSLKCIRVYQQKIDPAKSFFLQSGSAGGEMEKVEIDFDRISELLGPDLKPVIKNAIAKLLKS